MIRVLIDTDIFCKLVIADLLDEALECLGLDLADCATLPALRFMLKKGRLRKKFGEALCEKIGEIAANIQSIQPEPSSLLDQMINNESIDAGEAQLFAAAASNGFMVLSGDKRSIGELKKFPEIMEALSGRVVCLEALIIALYKKHGDEFLRNKIQSVVEFDKSLQTCFGERETRVVEGLESYRGFLVREANPLILWSPVE